MQNFSDRLISLRKERDMTQDELARALNLSRSRVSGYESQGKEPDFELLCKMAHYFGVSTDYLLGYSEARNNVAEVFYNDTVNFERHYRDMSPVLRPVVAKCFDSFYLLLGRDMKFSRPERLRLYQELLHILQSRRADIQKQVAAVGGVVSDPLALSTLMAAQSQLKNEVSALLDELMQADMEIAFNAKNGSGAAYSGETAI